MASSNIMLHTPLHTTAQAVAVLRFSSAGDIILTAPAVEALARALPYTNIIFVTHQQFAPLLRANPWIHEVVLLNKHESFWSLRRRLMQKKVDMVLDLHGKMRGAILRYALPVSKRVVWRKRDLAETLNMHLGSKRYVARMHVTQRYHLAVEALVGQTLPQPALRFYLPEQAIYQARTILQRYNIVPQQNVIGISPGALWKTKRWPLTRFIALAQWIVAQGFKLILTGSASERAANQLIVERVPQAINLAGEIELDVLGGIISACSVFVANDSGPMHMARALCVPTVAIFGSTSPEQFDFTNHALMYTHAPCSPCSFHGLRHCPRGHMHCLLDVQIQDVQNAIKQLLQQKRPQALQG